MDDQNCTGVGKFGIAVFQVEADIVTVFGVVGHDEEYGFFAKFFVFDVGFAPLFNAEGNIVGIAFSELRAGSFGELCPAGAVGEHRMLYNVLGDGFHQRIVADSLDKDAAVCVLWRCGNIYLERKEVVFLLEAVVNILNGFEPCEAAVVHVVSFVVDDYQLVNFADDHAKVNL